MRHAATAMAQVRTSSQNRLERHALFSPEHTSRPAACNGPGSPSTQTTSHHPYLLRLITLFQVSGSLKRYRVHADMTPPEQPSYHKLHSFIRFANGTLFVPSASLLYTLLAHCNLHSKSSEENTKIRHLRYPTERALRRLCTEPDGIIT